MRIKKILNILPIIFVFFTILAFVRLYDSLDKINLILREQTTMIQNSSDSTSGEGYANAYLQAQQAGKNANIALFAAILVSTAIIVLVWRSFGVINTKIEEMETMGKFAYQMAEGDFDVDLSPFESNDEFGVLARSFTNSTKTVKDLLSDIEDVSNQHSLGNIDACIDVTKYKGAYHDVSQSVSGMINSYVEMNHEISNLLKSFASGDYNAALKEFPGKRHETNKSVELLRQKLKSLDN